MLVKVLGVALASKALLIAALFAARTFDTSTQLLFELEDGTGSSLARRLMVWDTVYFVGSAQHGGHFFEHEYAFSPLWSALIRVLSPGTSLTSLALTAAAISLVSHLVACVLVLKLAEQIKVDRRAALIYAVSPAGIFMVSGYTESSCAALTFWGLLLFRQRAFVLAGIVWGTATLIRSNGLLWGICFVLALAKEVLRGLRWSVAFRLVLGGTILGLAFVYPQLVAYLRFCRGEEAQPWCSAAVPSIYTYVQAEYWHNGFLNYWTMPNLPLFLLALPTLTIVACSTLYLWRRKLHGAALVQLVMLVGLVFFWHVQIANRLSSSLPGPALYLAELLNQSPGRARFWIGLFVVWGVTQASLYGAFLPPA